MNDQSNNNMQHDDDEIDLLELFSTILNGKWTIIIFTLLTTIAAFVYAFGKTPIYKADTLLQVETTKAGIPGLDDIAGLNGDDTSVGTELEIIKSRKILGDAVKNLNLDVVVTPKRIPLFGNLSKRFFADGEISKLPSISDSIDSFTNQYAWGNEKITIARLEVPKSYLTKN